MLVRTDYDFDYVGKISERKNIGKGAFPCCFFMSPFYT